MCILEENLKVLKMHHPLLVICMVCIPHFFFSAAFSQSIITTLPGYPGELPFKLETGYITIGENEDVHLFYYFVESETDPRNDPVIIWLSSGPGCSTLRGFFYENGPLNFNFAESKYELTLELNPYSWTKVANLIYLDQPVGTGFSYADNFEASKTSDTLSATQTYEFLKKWVKYHPKFANNPLYIGGISYSGTVIPAVVHKIYKGNEDVTETRMNIKNIDKVNYVNILEPLCDTSHHQSSKLLERNGGSYQEDNPIFMNNTGCRDHNYIFLSMWGKMKTVQKALHIREGTVAEWMRCNKDLFYEFGKNASSTYWYDITSSVNYHRHLLTKNCRALIFSGDHDMVVPYLGTEKWIRSLNLTMKTNWDPWFVDNQIAGFKSTFSKGDYSLTFATLKGAGHVGP